MLLAKCLRAFPCRVECGTPRSSHSSSNDCAIQRLRQGLLYIIKKGLVVKNWRFLGSGRVFGEDVRVPHGERIRTDQK